MTVGDREAHQQALDNLIHDIQQMDMNGLIKSTPDLYEMLRDPVELEQVKAMFLQRADEIGDKKLIQKIMSSIEQKRRKDQKMTEVRINRELSPAFLDLDRDGRPLDTIQNFYNIMSCDHFYKSVRFNVISNQAQRVRMDPRGEVLDNWGDADDAESRNYIESQYHIYSVNKHSDALRMLFRAREYNPIAELVDSFEWDGVNRIEGFLTKWMKADDTPYVHEVSRLIFAGGINRLYNPGCKFDDVAVLVGTRQGEGKSSIVRWLAINDEWLGNLKRVEGQESVEAIMGKWICEIPELAAFKKADDVEAIKAFVALESDRYRRPYDRHPTEYPRRCIFIGTTNNDQFLVDKTGNRRFYPVYCHSDGYQVYRMEKECRAEIQQCWAEARERYKAGEMAPFAKPELQEEYRRMQELAMEDDWRIGKIGAYLDTFSEGDKVCAVQIFKECLNPDNPINPKMQDSRAIGQIMAKVDGWKKVGMARTSKYGVQRCWEKCIHADIVKNTVETAFDLPF